MERIGDAVLQRAIGFVESVDGRPASDAEGITDDAIAALLSPPPEHPGDLEELLDRFDAAADRAVETAGPGAMGWIPSGGIFASAVVDLYARVRNRYVGMTDLAPGAAALEHGVIRWMARLCGLPEQATGLLLSGGSLANLTAIVAARDDRLGGQIAAGTFYVSEHAHQSVTKAARLAGLPAANVRFVPTSSELRLDVAAAARMIAKDRDAGLRPFLLVGSAGTTNTGTIDELDALATLAAAERMWFHIDGAYGGLFSLTERGRARMRGLERADSITLDPHKSLFIPYGTGALLVRDPAPLRAAHASDGQYLQDLDTHPEVPDFSDLGPELSRELRGLRVWLPLHLYGVGAFRDQLDEKLDLTQVAYQRLSAEPALEVPWKPDLTVVAYRFRPRGDDAEAIAEADAASRKLFRRVVDTRRIAISTTIIDGRFTLRICILSHRTHADRVDEALNIIIHAARGLAPGAAPIGG